MDYEKVYGELHARNDKIFGGMSIKNHVEAITDLVHDYEPQRLLDYGCGKGLQYSREKVHESWGGPEPVKYDPGVPEFRAKPTGQFDGIICTDVMEHVETADVPMVLTDIFSYAYDKAFLYFCISCRPAKKKKLPDGRNVHVTVESPEWWDDMLGQYLREGLTVVVNYDLSLDGESVTHTLKWGQ